MRTILLILGNDTSPDSGGEYNRALHDVAIETLSQNQTILTTDIEDGWDIHTETEKFQAADAVIFQYPIFWYMPPASLKNYLDKVYAHGTFYSKVQQDGTAGLMSGHYMLSTTWNAPAKHFNNPATFFDGLTTHDTMVPMRKTQEFIGLKELTHFYCHEVGSKAAVKEDCARYKTHLEKMFLNA